MDKGGGKGIRESRNLMEKVGVFGARLWAHYTVSVRVACTLSISLTFACVVNSVTSKGRKHREGREREVKI